MEEGRSGLLLPNVLLSFGDLGSLLFLDFELMVGEKICMTRACKYSIMPVIATQCKTCKSKLQTGVAA